MFQLFYGGQQQGPYALDQIESMWASGMIPADALFWDEEAKEWKPISGVLSGIARRERHGYAIRHGVLPIGIPLCLGVMLVWTLLVSASPYLWLGALVVVLPGSLGIGYRIAAQQWDQLEQAHDSRRFEVETGPRRTLGESVACWFRKWFL